MFQGFIVLQPDQMQVGHFFVVMGTTKFLSSFIPLPVVLGLPTII